MKPAACSYCTLETLADAINLLAQKDNAYHLLSRQWPVEKGLAPFHLA